MRRAFVFLALSAACAGVGAETRSWNFRVLLDDRPIGEHRFRLTRAGEARELASDARFDVKLLFISAYRYEHEARERWSGECLETLVARTDDNGERSSVNAVARGGRLVVERPDGRAEHDGCVMSFAYWNPRILEARRLLNAQTGELQQVTVTRHGEETITARGGSITASRHRIRGERLEIDVWYADGDWVRLEAPAAGGRRLRYERM